MEQERLQKLREEKEIEEAAKALSISESKDETAEDADHNPSGFA